MSDIFQVVVCIWYVQELDANFIGVGCVKLLGPGNVWEVIGLVEDQVTKIFIYNYGYIVIIVFTHNIK